MRPHNVVSTVGAWCIYSALSFVEVVNSSASSVTCTHVVDSVVSTTWLVVASAVGTSSGDSLLGNTVGVGVGVSCDRFTLSNVVVVFTGTHGITWVNVFTHFASGTNSVFLGFALTTSVVVAGDDTVVVMVICTALTISELMNSCTMGVAMSVVCDTICAARLMSGWTVGTCIAVVGSSSISFCLVREPIKVGRLAVVWKVMVI